MTEGIKFDAKLTRKPLEIIQINLGDLCNQSCTHCHINASPDGKKNMNEKTSRKIIEKIREMNIGRVEFTGGAPEMNPNLLLFIRELAGEGFSLAVRTNLTILNSKQYKYLLREFKKYRVEMIASFPDVFKDTTDKQRGDGVFDISLKVLRELNKMGYGSGDLPLNLVYNPDGDFLPPEQNRLEREFRDVLKEKYNISFTHLHTIVNSPISRFKKKLKQEGLLNSYTKTLYESYNEVNNSKVMCTSQISVDYLGNIFDCDFNLALGLKIAGYETAKFWEIDFEKFSAPISSGVHCFACTVNTGSSCRGSLSSESDKNPGFNVKEVVKEYYGETLNNYTDLKTDACCTVDSVPDRIKKILPLIKEEIKAKYYGCGSPVPEVLKDLQVLDVGCGTGRDCYIMSKLVGEKGFVYGIDMTENQIKIAGKFKEDQALRFGYRQSNVDFINDLIENIKDHFKDESLDVVTSNCVINLLEDKEDVIRQIYQKLKFGGEFYFSDIYIDRRLPDHIRKDKILYGECMGGALYYKDFERIAKRVGFIDPRIVSNRILEIKDKRIKDLIGNAVFYSTTYRLWKLDGLEDACEDYGHMAIYRGGCESSNFSFELDNAHFFELGKPEKICGNTEKMISGTRFRKYFDIIGNYTTHFGSFKDCGESVLDYSGSAENKTGSCC